MCLFLSFSVCTSVAFFPALPYARVPWIWPTALHFHISEDKRSQSAHRQLNQLPAASLCDASVKRRKTHGHDLLNQSPLQKEREKIHKENKRRTLDGAAPPLTVSQYPLNNAYWINLQCLMQFLSFKDRDDVSFIELLLLREKTRVMMNICLYGTNQRCKEYLKTILE